MKKYTLYVATLHVVATSITYTSQQHFPQPQQSVTNLPMGNNPVLRLVPTQQIMQNPNVFLLSPPYLPNMQPIPQTAAFYQPQCSQPFNPQNSFYDRPSQKAQPKPSIRILLPWLTLPHQRTITSSDRPFQKNDDGVLWYSIKTPKIDTLVQQLLSQDNQEPSESKDSRPFIQLLFKNGERPPHQTHEQQLSNRAIFKHILQHKNLLLQQEIYKGQSLIALLLNTNHLTTILACLATNQQVYVPSMIYKRTIRGEWRHTTIISSLLFHINSTKCPEYNKKDAITLLRILHEKKPSMFSDNDKTDYQKLALSNSEMFQQNCETLLTEAVIKIAETDVYITQPQTATSSPQDLPIPKSILAMLAQQQSTPSTPQQLAAKTSQISDNEITLFNQGLILNPPEQDVN